MTATAMAATVSQFSCFSAASRSLHRSLRFNSKLSVVMSLERHDTNTAGSDAISTLSYVAEKGDAEKVGLGGTVLEEGLSQQKRTAKIHDFCLGIPFGGFVLGGGIIGFLLTRSLTTLSNGVLFGGAILLLSTLSLKVWRQGKSSLPFILGQSALSGILIWKNFQSYSLAKKVFPTGISAILSSAMLCFYLYVHISGGNPPPKKNKSSANMAS